MQFVSNKSKKKGYKIA